VSICGFLLLVAITLPHSRIRGWKLARFDLEEQDAKSSRKDAKEKERVGIAKPILCDFAPLRDPFSSAS
jgi:hypothetical protein